MFWGIILEPKKRYTQTVEQSFHVSMAALDVKQSNGQKVQVMVKINDKNYLLCTLNDTTTPQTNLDLNFEQGTEISFMHNGKNNFVHLTGYLIPEDEQFDDNEEEEQEDEELEVEETEEPTTKRTKKTKTTLVDLIDQFAAEGSEADETFDAEGMLDSDDEDEEMEESDDENEEDDSDEDEEETKPKLQNGKNKEENDEDSEDDDDEDEDDDDDDEEEEEEQVPKKRKLQNGTAESPKQTKKEKKQKEKQVASPQNNASPNKKTLEGGVLIKDLKVGNGSVAKPGKLVEVYYVGRLKSNNKQFDAQKSGTGFKFRLGKQEVIKGWDVGVRGMKVGGKREIVCPPGSAYGAKGSPPVIPPNSTLVFEVELREVK